MSDKKSNDNFDDEIMSGFTITFMDENDSSDDENSDSKSETNSDNKSETKSNNKSETKSDKNDNEKKIDFECNTSLLDVRPVTCYMFPSIKNYDFKSWNTFFNNEPVNILKLIFNGTWSDFFASVQKKKYINKIQEILTKAITKKQTIVPYPELMFNTLNILSPHYIKVVIIGQDPYFNINKIDQKDIPQAMGCSFSVPLNYPKPPSLTNIYNNLYEHGHLKKIPESGNLSFWLIQGCLMINAAFTTIHGQPNVHKNTWKEFTTDLLKYINVICENVVFLVWGKDAHMLCLNIDPERHHIITSSHPSPMSFTNEYNGLAYGIDSRNRKQVTYPPFKHTDHFGLANEYLRSKNKHEILWDMFD